MNKKIVLNIKDNNKNGFYYGVNLSNNDFISYNKNNQDNGHEFILGFPGSGKSYIAKHELKETYLKTNDDIIVIQDRNEDDLGCIPKSDKEYCSYSSLAELLNETHIRVPMCNINPFELNSSNIEGNENILTKISFLLQLITSIMGKDLSAKQKSLLSTIIYKMYLNYIASNYEKKYVPTFSSFLDNLMKQDEIELSDIIEKIKDYLVISNNQFNCDNKTTFGTRLVVYSMWGVSTRLYRETLVVLLDNIYNRVVENYLNEKKTHIIIDTCEILFMNPILVTILDTIIRRLRTYGARITLISSNARYLLTNEFSNSIFCNMATIRLLGQSSIDKSLIQEYFNIPGELIQYICDMPRRGEGLLCSHNKIIPFLYE